MPEVEIKDGGDSSMVLCDINGQLYPNFSEEIMRGVPSFKLRPDDVILSAYPKSGTHWVWEILRFLQAGTTDLEVVEKSSGFMELLPQDHFEKLPSPRTLNTHVWYRNLPLKDMKCKVVLLMRNPKDLAVSHYNHVVDIKELYKYNGTWDNFLQLFLEGKVEYGSWFDYTLHWEESLKSYPGDMFLTVMYEDLIRDPVKEIKRMAKFLRQEYSEEFLKQVRDKCSIDHMRKQKGNELLGPDGKPVFYRKGGTGGWKDWFTVAQSEQLDALYREKMKNSKLHFTFT